MSNRTAELGLRARTVPRHACCQHGWCSHPECQAAKGACPHCVQSAFKRYARVAAALIERGERAE